MRSMVRLGLVLVVPVPFLAGCSVATPRPPTGGGTPAAAPSAGDGASPSSSSAGGGQCRYLSVEDIRQALAYQGTMSATEETPLGFPRCRYAADGNGFVGAIVSVQAGRTYFDQQKSLQEGGDCGPAGVGEESVACPKSDQGNVLFLAKGQSVSISVTNVQSLTGPKGTDWTQAAIALSTMVASRL